MHWFLSHAIATTPVLTLHTLNPTCLAVQGDLSVGGWQPACKLIPTHWYYAIKCNAAQYSSIKCNPVQYNAIQCWQLACFWLIAVHCSWSVSMVLFSSLSFKNHGGKKLFRNVHLALKNWVLREMLLEIELATNAILYSRSASLLSSEILTEK